MDKYEVKTIYGKINKDYAIMAKAPGSKSITNRALLIASLAEGKTVLDGVLFSDDSRHFMECVKNLGIGLEIDEENKRVSVTGYGRNLPKKEASLYVGSAGTAARFLSAALGAVGGKYYLDASEQMKRRPMAPLLDALSQLGCIIDFSENVGHFPFTLESKGFDKDRISVNIDSSSQFLSALLISAVAAEKEFTVDVTGSHGMAYADMTVRMMGQFGVEVTKIEGAGSDKVSGGDSDGPSYKIPGGVSYRAQNYEIEPDASAAAYFYAMCPLLNVPVCVPGIRLGSLQGDVGFLDILVKMGCELKEYGEVSESIFAGCAGAPDAKDLVLLPPSNGSFHGIEVDMSACSDQAITLAAIAPFADSPTMIKGIGHIRLQESDRLSAIENELRKMGIKTESGEDFIKIWPGEPKPAVIETYEDHRMAMGFSLTGLRAEGIVIDNPGCCAKTFENYFEVLDGIIRNSLEN